MAKIGKIHGISSLDESPITLSTEKMDNIFEEILF